MIVFYTDDFQLDFSNEKITFIEENNIFHDYFLKGHSLPFSFSLNDDLKKKIGFVSDYNTSISTLRYEGKLLKNDSFEDAYLIIKSIIGHTLQGSLYYGKSSIQLLETPLSELPFPVIDTDNIGESAKDIILQSWPETAFNFPMIIDKEFEGGSDYNDFRGFHNLYENDAFVQNTSFYDTDNQEYEPRNYNILSPCIYLIEILKVGFTSANMVMRGDLVNDLAFHKIVYFPENHLEELDGDNVNQFKDTFNLSDYVPDMTFGAYLTKLKNWLNLDISFRKNIVSINYIEQNFRAIKFIDARHLEVRRPRMIPCNDKIYKLVYSDAKFIFIGKSGMVVSPTDFAKVSEINMGINLLEEGTYKGVTTAELKEDESSFRVLLYDGVQGEFNLAVSNVLTRTFDLNEVYDRYWKKWLAFRLNSKTFKSSFKTAFDELSVSDGIHFYNNNHLIKKITKRMEGQNEYKITIETETIL